MYSDNPVTTWGCGGTVSSWKSLIFIALIYSIRGNFVNLAPFPLIPLVCVLIFSLGLGGWAQYFYHADTVALEASRILAIPWKNSEIIHCMSTIGPG